MAAVGFPVTVQRNSARWPCWTFSTEGVTVATGWASSEATEGETSVRHGTSWRGKLHRGVWRNKAGSCGRLCWCCRGEVRKPHVESTSECLGVPFSCDNPLYDNNSKRAMASAPHPHPPHPHRLHLHPWQTGTKRMESGRKALACPERFQGDGEKERPHSVGGEGVGGGQSRRNTSGSVLTLAER